MNIANKKKLINNFVKNTRPLLLNCEVMDADNGYYWGDPYFIPELLKIKNPTKKPYAEIWVGAHKKAPSRALINKQQISLDIFFKYAGHELLGKNIVKKWGNKLPFLLKILTAAKPLSLQVHPDKKQAEEGWQKENGEGPNYKDNNHKPELICALTDFWALNGFRDIKEIVEQFEELNLEEIAIEFEDFKKTINNANNQEKSLKNAIKKFYSFLIQLEDTKIASIIAQLKKRALTIEEKSYEKFKYSREYWLLKCISACQQAIEIDVKSGNIKKEDKEKKIKQAYTGIPCIYLLNLCHLNPGEAMYLPAGMLHSYLQGAGVEVMASSDNVLRGGITHKHIDIKELIHILKFKIRKPEIILPKKQNDFEYIYQTPAKEFELTVLKIKKNQQYLKKQIKDIEILFVSEGEVKIINKNNYLELSKGQFGLIPAIAGSYSVNSITDNSTIYTVGVPFPEN